MNAARYDIDLDPDSHDLTSLRLGCSSGKAPFLERSEHRCLRLGFLVALQYAMRLRAGGLMMSGLPCSMHVWISRGTSGKSRGNPRGALPAGGYKHSCVETANKIAARFALVALLCHCRQVWWITEQPGTSVAHFLPYIRMALFLARLMLGFSGGVLQKMPLGAYA